jgi:chromate transporter
VTAAQNEAPGRPRLVFLPEVLLVFLRLGLMSFGGPIAHIGYFRNEIVERRKWVPPETFADLVALCQFLPGPASSELGVALGMTRAGLLGGLAAWVGFTAPSALAMIAFAYGVGLVAHPETMAFLHGLKILAVAVVAQAVWAMAKNLCPDRERATLAVGATILVLIFPSAQGQTAAILLGAYLGWRFLPAESKPAPAELPPLVSRPVATGAFVLFVLLLVLPSFAASVTGDRTMLLFANFYRSGALVFGGGHVVLPLLQEAVVQTGFVGKEAFLTGYGAAQAVPGPLFSFAAYLGALAEGGLSGWRGGLFCLVAIYLPSFLLLLAALPFWETLRREPQAQATLKGVNAVVVGLLLAALYTPVFTTAVRTAGDFGLALVCWLLLEIWRLPPVFVALFAALAAEALGLLRYFFLIG